MWVSRVLNISERRKSIVVSNKDAVKFLKDLKGKGKFVYLDLPYYVKGKSLYLDYYSEKDHYLLAKYLKSTNKFKWILSYDNVEAIRNLYSDYELYEFDLNYTANLKKIEAELLTCSRNLIMPSERVIRRKETCLNLKKIDLSLMG